MSAQAASRPAGADPQLYRVAGMRCAACASAAEKRAKAFPGVRRAKVSYASRLMQLEWKPAAHPDPPGLVADLEAAGFQLREAATDPGPDVAGDEGGDPAWVTPAGAAVTLAVFAWEHRAPGAGTVARAALTAATLALAARPFFRGAIDATRRGSGTMDTLVSLGVTAAFAAALAATLRPAWGLGPPHFGAPLMLVLFLRVGRDLEARMRRRARTGLDALREVALPMAELLRPEGGTREVPADGLRRGDRVRVRSGGKLPADGVVEAGESEVEEAFLTGEARPRPVAPGDEVFAGAINGSGALTVRVTRLAADTLLARLRDLAAASLLERPPIQRFADRAAAAFVPAVLGLAGLTAAGWMAATGDGVRAFWAATAVVVVACPCALGLATPTAVMVASGLAQRLGFLIRSGPALEALGGVDKVVLDKTGTLTTGEFRVISVEPAGPETSPAALFALACRLEAGSSHPLARAFTAANRPADLAPVDPSPPETAGWTHQDLPGRGVLARDPGGVAYRIGSPAWLAAEGVAVPEDPADAAEAADRPLRLGLARAGEWLGAFTLDDPPRADADELLGWLADRGLEPEILSGDSPARVETFVAGRAATGRGGLTPEDKLARIRALQAEGRVVAYLGDGLNDTPAMGLADVAVAMGEGSARARSQADVVLLTPRLAGVADALFLARRALQVIRRNLWWAVGYNLLGLPAAAGVFYPFTGRLLPPHFAGAAMALSSVTVVASSLSLWKEGRRR